MNSELKLIRGKLQEPAYSEPLSVSLELLAQKANAEGYRQVVMAGYGFTPAAMRFITEKSDYRVAPKIKEEEMQGWSQPPTLNGKGSVRLFYWEAQGTLHECAHVYWHWRRIAHPEERLGLCRDLVTVSKLVGTEYDTLARFAEVYLYGDGGNFPGMYSYQGLHPRNLHDIDMNDLSAILDWEIFAGLASWTMGAYKSGVHLLPPLLWRYFEPMFTGRTLLKPYYL